MAGFTSSATGTGAPRYAGWMERNGQNTLYFYRVVADGYPTKEFMNLDSAKKYGEQCEAYCIYLVCEDKVVEKLF